MNPTSFSAPRNASTTCRARSRRQAFMIAAFSRSSRPIRPISADSVICVPGSASARISPARFSNSFETGENTDDTATDLIPLAAICAAIPRNSASSSGEITRPSNSLPPCARYQWLPSTSRRSAGQSTIGGRLCVAGRHSRTVATCARSRRCTTALVKCVVPIITTSTLSAVVLAAASTSRSALTTPVITSPLVAAFTPATTVLPSISTASVFVPPTSIPIRIMCSVLSVMTPSAPKDLPPSAIRR